MEFKSQGNQDKWVSILFENAETKFYVDVGAMDGFEFSNTYSLEKFFGWSGICIEANSHSFNQLQQNRQSKNIHSAVTHYKGFCNLQGDGPCCHVIEGSQGDTPCDTLQNILDESDSPKVINYLSMDIEGYEFEVLKNFDFDKYEIQVITIEHNLYCDGPNNKDRLFDLLTTKGFIRVVDNAVCLDPAPHVNNQPYEDWFINSKCEHLLENSISKIQPK